ncbi:hypothetical protein B0T09DRAFT_113891 [Sordaria sp. MPI-SDFR-AT-0083]|nr:hypothetical protein B0T09DRAFT_113891 [Sordaria sp. MPI-SDFR-AT-0083]
MHLSAMLEVARTAFQDFAWESMQQAPLSRRQSCISLSVRVGIVVGNKYGWKTSIRGPNPFSDLRPSATHTISHRVSSFFPLSKNNPPTSCRIPPFSYLKTTPPNRPLLQRILHRHPTNKHHLRRLPVRNAIDPLHHDRHEHAKPVFTRRRALHSHRIPKSLNIITSWTSKTSAVSASTTRSCFPLKWSGQLARSVSEPNAPQGIPYLSCRT